MSTQTTAAFTMLGERDDLLASLQSVERFVAKVKSSPAVTGIRIRYAEGEGYVEATNLTMSLRMHLWATFDVDEVDVIVSPRLVKAIQSCPSGGVTIRFDGETCTVTGSSRSKYVIGTIVGDWPNFQVGDERDWSDVPVLDASEVFEAMTIAGKFASRDDNRPTITGINVRSDEDLVRISATDSYRLFTTRVNPNEFWQEQEDITVPYPMVVELTRLFPSGEIKLSASDNLFFVAAPSGGTYFSCRRIGGKFPETQTLVPKDEDFKWDVGVPRDALKDALRRIRFMAEGSKKPLQVSVEDDEMMLVATTDTGNAEEYIDLPFEHEKITVGLNLDQLSSVLEVFKGDEVRMRFVSELRPVLVTAEDEEPVTLLMPVRVK